MLNKNQVEKYREVIIWWCTNLDKGVWMKGQANYWSLNKHPEFDTDPELTYVQNDEYAEWRKAYADNPNIQFQVSYDGGNIWYDKTFSKMMYKAHQKIRIKPDKYAELREAQANGKIIQFKHKLGGLSDWIDWIDGKTRFCETIDCYRIKPEFKVGDWVIHDSGLIGRFDIDGRSEIKGIVNMIETSIPLRKKDMNKIKLWKPEAGEWCVFWENSCTYYVERFQSYSINIKNVAPLEFLQTLKDK